MYTLPSSLSSVLSPPYVFWLYVSRMCSNRSSMMSSRSVLARTSSTKAVVTAFTKPAAPACSTSTNISTYVHSRTQWPADSESSEVPPLIFL